MIDKPIPRIECSTCGKYWQRLDANLDHDVVPIPVEQPVRRKGLMEGKKPILPQYYHNACRDEKDPEKGKIVGFYHDDFGRRVGI